MWFIIIRILFALWLNFMINQEEIVSKIREEYPDFEFPYWMNVTPLPTEKPKAKKGK